MRYSVIDSAISLEVTGKDATRYLNSRLTNDIKAMKPGEAREAAAITAQGRTQGYFLVILTAEDKFLLLGDGGDHSRILGAVKQFLVADRVTIWDKCRGWRLAHCYDEPSREICGELKIDLPKDAPENLCISGKESFWVRRSRSRAPGWDVAVSETSEAELVDCLTRHGAVALSPAERRLLRFRAGIPSFPEEMNEDHLFAESGMLKAVSSTKGCYVGQEVMSKIEALGRLPSKLFLLSLEGKQEVPKDAPIFLGDFPLGKVVSSVWDEEARHSLFFAYLKRSPDLNLESMPFVLGQRARIMKEIGTNFAFVGQT